MRGFKLMRRRKDGSLGPLFINRRQRIEEGKWLKAECCPTKGFAVRPGWHILLEPEAPHLKMKGDRVWVEVQFDFFKARLFERPKEQGGMWALADEMRVVRRLT